MSKGSKRRNEDTNRVRKNWDNIDWSKGKKEEHESESALHEHIRRRDEKMRERK